MLFIEVRTGATGNDGHRLFINAETILWLRDEGPDRCSAMISHQGLFHVLEIDEPLQDVLAKIQKQGQ